ncbi:MAG TPA: tetratricopeptide repeat protein, partial [Gammaproteobacteria bacterium]|nr:tetratricopeptide repeat protein [Gammaproteobacteria bacterium]
MTEGPVDGPWREAQALIGQGRYAEALSRCLQVTKREPRHADATHYLGLCYFQTGERERAAQFMSRSLELSPDDAVFHNNYALVLQALGEVPTAERHFRRALEIDAGYSDPRFNLGKILYDSERFDESLEQFRMVKGQTPNDADARRYLALTAAAAGEVSAAISEWQDLHALKGGLDRSDRKRYGQTLEQCGRLEAAGRQYEELAADDPADIDTLYRLARLAERSGRLEDAWSWLDRVREHAAGHELARVLHGRLLWRTGSDAEAVAWLEQLDDLTAPRARAERDFELGTALERGGSYGAAFDAFQRYSEQCAGWRPARYAAEDERQRFGRIRRVFTRGRLRALDAAAPAVHAGDPEPVFVTGFPRSGTTLV